ncbi:MAG TPA: LysR family transcriptional regulator [Candidatus Limnocylindrales bacterium]|nr:LysR family transcriptional regulator [Candidatus Limnocylindrales bacterium]
MSLPRISLDQWAVLVAVVEAGGYARAAERLHKTQSTLTYAVQKMEGLLGVKVFEIRGRKAVLTGAGEVLYRRGRELLEEAGRLERVAGHLAQGWEAEIRVACEIIFPTWLLLECLATFSDEHPDTRIELVETVLGGTEEALLDHRVDLGITSAVPAGMVGDLLMTVGFVCVAAPSHPLHQLGRELTARDLRAHRHLVVRDSGTQRVRRAGWLGEQRWTVTAKATSIRAAVMGLGYAWYPQDSIRAELDSGQLVRLPLREGRQRAANLYVVLADREAAGPGVLRVAELIRTGVAQRCAEDEHAISRHEGSGTAGDDDG